MDNNGDPNNMNNQADYGNEDYDGGAGDNQPGADNMGGEEVDQYFDDAGDIGYLPADHVRIIIIS